jgi:hypothetical protein
MLVINYTMSYTGQKMKDYLRDYLPKWRARRRQEAIIRLGGKCVHCGSTERLEFDHIDPTTKVAAIGRLWVKSAAIFEAELKKCQLLCKSCHLAKSRAYGELSRGATHGSWSYVKVKKCRCDICLNRFLELAEARRQRYRVRTAASIAVSKTEDLSSSLRPGAKFIESEADGKPAHC